MASEAGLERKSRARRNCIDRDQIHVFPVGPGSYHIWNIWKENKITTNDSEENTVNAFNVKNCTSL